MIFFLVWSLYLLHSGKWKWAGIVFALSISVKLIPLMFLPLFYQWFKKQESGIFKLVGFYTIVGISTLLLFSPFYSSEFVNNYSQTVALWFGRFEFNAIYLPKYNKEKPLYLGFFNTGAYQETIGGFGGLQHCLIPSPKHILIDRDEEGQLTTKLFSEQQKSEDLLKILGYNG